MFDFWHLRWLKKVHLPGTMGLPAPGLSLGHLVAAEIVHNVSLELKSDVRALLMSQDIILNHF